MVRSHSEQTHSVRTSFINVFDAGLSVLKREEIIELEKKRARVPTSHYSQAAANSSEITGDDRLAKLRRALDSFGVVRSKDQKRFHNEMIRAVLPQIYKTDLEANIERLLAENNWADVQQQLMIVTPRRWGKTWSVAMFVAAFAYACSSTEQSIFSTGRRASQKLLELVYKFLCRLDGAKESIMKYNVETIWMEGDLPGEEHATKIFSYPSKVKIELIFFFLLLLFSYSFCARALT